MQKIITIIGMLMFLIGGCSMDSKSLLIPAVLAITGLGLVALTIDVNKI